MVNVNAALPFNLQNKTLHMKFDPSTSRSAWSLSMSAATVHPDFVSFVSDRRLSDTSGGADGSRLPSYSPTRSRDLSPSLQTSRSTTSLHPGDASSSQPGVYLDNGARLPVFNARMIPANGGFRAGSSSRGRSRTRGRLGRFGEERGRSTPESQQRTDESESSPEGMTDNGVAVGDAPVPVDNDLATTPTIHSPSTIRQLDDFDSDGGTPLGTEFRIQDVGKISRSWGD